MGELIPAWMDELELSVAEMVCVPEVFMVTAAVRCPPVRAGLFGNTAVGSLDVK